MFARIALVCICVLSLPATVFGQGTLDTADKAEIAAIRAQLNGTNERLDKLTDQIAALTAAAKPSKSLEERVNALENQQIIADDTLRDHGAAIGQIATRSGSNYHWRFDATSQPAVDEFKKAIKATAPTGGTLYVRNLSGVDKWLVVNGKQELVMAGITRGIPVQLGMVTTRLHGENVTKSWFVGMPSYEYSIDIKNNPYVPVVTRVYEYPASIGWVAAY
jgi:hypothetical protein